VRLRYWITGLAIVGLLTSSHSAPAKIWDPLGKINHIVVIFLENRSFDSLFGDFPGANGRANAGEATRQIGPDGVAYEYLPAVRDTNQSLSAVEVRFPARMPNGPFNLGRYVPLFEKTGDLIHKFHQEQMQINGGAMNRFADISDAGGLVMGYYDMKGTNA
jgi:phospholipase C